MERFRLFKNTFFPSAKCNSWDVYWSCNKRFFAYYTLQFKGGYIDDAKSFILSRAHNKNFDIGSGVILKQSEDILIERDREDRFYNNFSPANFRKWLFRFMFLENKLPLQEILVTMNILICNIVNYISDDEMIAGCTDRIGNGNVYILEDWCWRVLEEYERIVN